MKKLLLSALSFGAIVALMACSGNTSSTSPADNCPAGGGLTKDCLKGTWSLTSYEIGSSPSSTTVDGTLKLTKNKFVYTPTVDDKAHTYCPGSDFSGTYEIVSPTQITFTLESFTAVGLCFTSKSVTVEAEVNETTLKITGGSIEPNGTLFHPNDEGADTEVYTRR